MEEEEGAGWPGLQRGARAPKSAERTGTMRGGVRGGGGDVRGGKPEGARGRHRRAARTGPPFLGASRRRA